MSSYIIRRTLVLIPTLFVITVIIFSLIHMAPGKPINAFMNPNADPSELERVRAKFGLNEPLPVQYFRWLKNLFTLNMGISINYGVPVWQLIAPRLPDTLLLMGCAMIFEFAVAIPLGTISAIRQYSYTDNIVTAFAFWGLSTPNFWLGLLLVWLFAVHWGILPSFGTHTTGIGGGFVDRVRHLILPVIVIGTAGTASITRYMRSQVLEVMNEDYVNTARAKGVKEIMVTFKHILRNSMLPIITMFGLSLPMLVSGAVITEQIFGWPGIGYFFWSSVGQRDYPVIMTILTISAILTLAGNFLADLLYGVLDPRIRYD